MKILVLGSAASTHTFRWVNSLIERGLEVCLMSVEAPTFKFDCQVEIIAAGFSSIDPISLIVARNKVRRYFRAGSFDILHAHYAGFYGLVGALSKIHPFVLSVWGSDVLVTPQKSLMHLLAVGWLLKRADLLQSTSNCMADEVFRLYGIKIKTIIPFGVDTSVFLPHPRKEKDDSFNLVVVKSLHKHYGLDLLLKALAKVRTNNRKLTFNCSIYGDGPAKSELAELTNSLQLNDLVSFHGVAQTSVIPRILAEADLAVYFSRTESFGVSALEAMASGCPVVLSDAPGHVEICSGLINASIVPRGNIDKLAESIIFALTDNFWRIQFATSARRMVQERYEWSSCVAQQIQCYDSIAIMDDVNFDVSS